MTHKTSGTKEWASSNVNFQFGCENGCKYCYAFRMARRRTHHPRSHRKDLEDWTNHIEIREEIITKRFGKRHGRVMFPTTHDITENNVKYAVIILRNLLARGNEVLITTKPRLKVIQMICAVLAKFKPQIQFRFTITSRHDRILKEWEPNAPSFNERMESLYFAHMAGFKTSISIEPCLEADPRILVGILEPCVTESIWLGPMNHCGKHDFNSEKTLWKWWEWFQDRRLIRFKDAFFNKLHLDQNKILEVKLEHDGIN